MKDELRVGAVFYLYNSDIIPNNFKYSICVHIKPHYFFVINTENRKMYDCVPILKKDNAFLQYDSYIGCANYFVYKSEDIKDKKIVGYLGYEDLNRLYLHLKNNVKSLPASIKKEILQSLNDELDEYR